MIANMKEYQGTLHADGHLVFDELPAIAPGRMLVTLSPLPAKSEREPGAIFLDDCISAPFDLPYEGPVTSIAAEWVDSREPDLSEFTAEM